MLSQQLIDIFHAHSWQCLFAPTQQVVMPSLFDQGQPIRANNCAGRAQNILPCFLVWKLLSTGGAKLEMNDVILICKSRASHRLLSDMTTPRARSAGGDNVGSSVPAGQTAQ